MKNVSFDWTNFIGEISAFDIDYKDIPQKMVDFQWSLVPIYPNCQLLDPKDYFDLLNVSLQLLSFRINKFQETGLNVYLVERESRSFRPLKSFFHQIGGDPMTIENLENPRVITFDIKLEKNIHSDRNEKQPCVNYPTKEFDTFGECDKQFVKNQFRRKYMGNPIWLADSLDDVTNER